MTLSSKALVLARNGQSWVNQNILTWHPVLKLKTKETQKIT